MRSRRDNIREIDHPSISTGTGESSITVSFALEPAPSRLLPEAGRVMHSVEIVVRGGTIGSASDTYVADVGICGESIVTIGQDLPQTKLEIDATDKLVLPGGVDTRAHIEQLLASGIMTADDFRSATTAAAFGGTTTVISFAAQHVGMALAKVVFDYHAAAQHGATIDYGFHMIVADPTAATLAQIPKLVRAGHSTIKISMTYDRLRLDEKKILDVLISRGKTIRNI